MTADLATLAREAVRDAAAKPRREASPTIRKLFMLLHGSYGNTFLAKFATGEKSEAGGDKGVNAAMLVWDSALSRFAPDVIEAAAKRLRVEDPNYPPNLPQMERTCAAIEPRKTYAELSGVARLPAPVSAPVQVNVAAVGDGRDWARRILARRDAGDRISPACLASAERALKGRAA